jgi:uncharacterized lipoprotein YmbA
VELPKYLDRPSIITQVGNNELTFSEFHRWAGPLDDNIRQVLIENLSRKLHAAHIVPDSRGLPDAPDLHVKVSITDFSGTLGKAAHLQAVWTLSAADQSAAAGSFEKEIPLSSDRYTDYVSAQSILLGNLAEKIAEAISSP